MGRIVAGGGVMSTPTRHRTAPPERTSNTGWSEGVARRHRDALMARGDTDIFDGGASVGVAFSLTIRDCPPTAKDWALLVKAFLNRLERSGCLRLHWVTEWQRRGCPHLHGFASIAAVGEPEACRIVRDCWMGVAVRYGAGMRAHQLAGPKRCVRAVHDLRGWQRYLNSHLNRSAKSYQRAGASLPDGWESTGRVWGFRGSWEVDAGVKLDEEEGGRSAWYDFRRVLFALSRSAIRRRTRWLAASRWHSVVIRPAHLGDHGVRDRGDPRVVLMRENQREARSRLRLPSPDAIDPDERAFIWRQRSTVRGASYFYPRRELLRLALLLYGGDHGATDRATGEWRTIGGWIDRDPAAFTSFGEWFRHTTAT